MSSKSHIHYLPIAQKDLSEIIEYIQLDNPSAALEFLNTFDNTVSLLPDFPLMGKVPRDKRLEHLRYRILVIGNYLLFYVISGHVIEIRRILHGKRKYDFLL